MQKQSLKQSDRLTTDIVIVGGGLAGLSMASALRSLPLKIIILESHQSLINEKAKQVSPSFDDRALALSQASIQILRNIGIFTEFDQQFFTPIEQIHVSDKGHFGALRMQASEVGYDSLGQVISAPVLGSYLANFLQKTEFQAQIKLIDQTSVNHILHQQGFASVSVFNEKDIEQVIDAKLIILADGGRSELAEQVGLSKSQIDYQQNAILTNVMTNQAHQNCAYERFTENGPVALLPMGEQEYKLVWTVEPEQVDSALACSDEDFIKQLTRQFGSRAGRFIKIGKRISYPMVAQQRRQIVSGRVALIGNAAHSLHPIAGQGFNLGLRDIAALSEIIAMQQLDNADIGAAVALMQYQAGREQDIQRTALFTDQLVKLFSNDHMPLALIRNAGLVAVDQMPMLKKKIMLKLMGLGGQQFKLLTGESLLPGSV